MTMDSPERTATLLVIWRCKNARCPVAAINEKDERAKLQQAVIDNRNVFEVLMDAVRVCSLGQVTSALFEVGGQYRRNM